MPVEAIDIDTFLQKRNAGIPLLDVRSPAEFLHAHIPGAYALPLFSDDERKVVGTAYKQESREIAIKKGLDYFGPKMRGMVETVENLPDAPRELLLHCWRGGMRSSGVAWLLDLYGFRVSTLKGGYKAFRQWVLQVLASPFHMQLLGGYTGSGKTQLLQRLARLGEPVIDLEALASHRGSAFGHLGLPEQPSQEMFENRLALALAALPGRSFWVEDESIRIGKLLLPHHFQQQMRAAPCYFVQIPFEERLDFLLTTYGDFDREKLVMAIFRIQKRLGGLETKQALQFLLENNTREAFAILLRYYDKWYDKAMKSRVPGAKKTDITLPTVNEINNTHQILNAWLSN